MVEELWFGFQEYIYKNQDCTTVNTDIVSNLYVTVIYNAAFKCKEE